MEQTSQKIGEIRQRIDEIDRRIIKLLEERVAEAKEIGGIKKAAGLPIRDPKREEEVIRNASKSSELSPSFVKKLFKLIVGYCGDEED
jgi:chorismate mutase